MLVGGVRKVHDQSAVFLNNWESLSSEHVLYC